MREREKYEQDETVRRTEDLQLSDASSEDGEISDNESNHQSDQEDIAMGEA
jgi:hypothetical protein